MLELLKLRYHHGKQAIKDVRSVRLNSKFKGYPLILESKLTDEGKAAKEICPTNAIELNPFSINLSKCIFCGECEKLYDNEAIKFTSEYKLASTSKENLVIHSDSSHKDFYENAIKVKKEIKRIFGHSLKLRQVSAGGCNGCELELAATLNVNFDMGRFGIEFTASPRHADGIVLTGPISKNMSLALKDAYTSVSEPKIVIAVGACAISGGIFADSDELDRTFIDEVPIDLFIPGCPPHPLTFINGILDFLSKK